ncbi:MAG: TRAP transporter large permease subunit [Rhodospirillaceae bacterium]|nr:TRAP transporter large permease subunit [Rhodospirillaceae bacterium]
MSNPEIGVMMLALFIFVIMLGFPIAFSLMAMGVGFAFYYFGFRDGPVFALVVRKTFEVMSNEVLLPVPLFLFMGYVVERAAILDRLFRSIQIAARGMPASLAIATLLTCALFATATGIVGAVVTLMGLLAFPAMLRAGYDVKLSAGVVCAGGCLGILIPPSIMLILYGATAGVSPVQLYAGAFFPGLMLAGLYMTYVMGRAIINPRLAPKLPKEETDVPFLKILWMLATSFLPLAGLIVAVLGAIVFGLATPSEAAAIGALGALILAVSYGQFTFAKLRESVYLTARATAMVCWLFVGSSIFSSVFGLLGGQDLIKEWMLALDLGPIGFMLVVQAIIFLLGWPLEWTEIIVIFVPIFLPLLHHFGVDPLFFGLLVALNIQTSFLSPPVAMAGFYLKGVAPPHVTLNQIFAGMLPFMFIVLISMALLYIFPGIGLWLPGEVYGR